MSIESVISGFFVYFIALALSGIAVFLKGQVKKAQLLFVVANLIGFFTGLIYLIKFSSQNLVLANWNWFFHFSPTITLLSGIFFTLISLVSALVGIYSVRYLQLYEKSYSTVLTQFLTVFFVLGMQGVMLANNSFSFLFFWEVMSIASFFLVLADRTDESVRAAFIYFIMTHLGASAILGGFLILGNGSIFFDLVGVGAASQDLSPFLLSLSFVLFLFGFGSKAGLVPFHVWLPEAHPQAPSNVSALMSGLMLKVAVYGFIKIAFAYVGLPVWAGIVVIALGLLSGIVGALYAVIERDMKRAFAYSSIENMGIIFTILGMSIYLLAGNFGTATGALATSMIVFAILHAINHAFFKTALFLASGVVISRFHSKRLEVMGGLAKIMPIFSFAFLIAILASAPIPPFGTFYGEWGFIQSIITLMHERALDVTSLMILLAALALIGLISGLAIFAMVKIFGISMLGLPRDSHVDKGDEKEDTLLIYPILTLGALVVVMGIFAKSIILWLTQNIGLILSSNQSSEIVTSKLSSELLFLVFVAMGVLVYFLRNILTKKNFERKYQTWDCGQPINSSMEYSATAFSAPMRFFFLYLLKRTKSIESIPVVVTNPWIRKYTFSLNIKSVWKEKLYEPVASILNFFAERVKVIQGGRIQYYLLFVLGTLIVTLIIVL
jgi:formate hydrogenlyase subunit 3/multisubunit Na+/H+ antiporter MnhD subunit